MKEEFRRAVETVAAMAGDDAAETGTPMASEPDATADRAVPLGRFGVFSTHERHDDEGTFTDPLTENGQELAHPASENSQGMPGS